MTLVLLRVKLAILRNGLIGSRSRVVSAILFVTAMLGGSIAAAVRLAHAGSHPHAQAQESLTIGLTVLFGLWVFGPLLMGGVDDALDPTRLALLPLRKRELRRGLLFGALLGALPLATVITLIGVVVGYAPRGGPVASAVVPISCSVLLLFCLGASRSLAVGLAFAGRSRRGKDLSVLLASLGAAALFLGTQSIRFPHPDQKARAIGVLRHLPPGQIATAILDVHERAPLGPVLIRVAVTLVTSLALLRVWVAGVDRLLVDPESVRHHRRTGDRRAIAMVPRLLRPWAHVPIVAMTAKELRYLLRSPQRRSSLIISVVIGTVFALLQSMRYDSANALAVFGAPIAVLFGVHATNNLLGTDARSLWMEQAAGARLRDQLVARGIAATPNLFIPTILAATVLAAMTGGWSELALVSALALTCWGLPLGVGSVVSVIAPFNQPDVGNPYSNKRSNTGQSGLVSLMAFVGITALIAAALPIVMLVAPAWERQSFPGTVLAVTACFAYSLGFWAVGVWAALRIVRGREVDLLAGIGGRRAAT